MTLRGEYYRHKDSEELITCPSCKKQGFVAQVGFRYCKECFYCEDRHPDDVWAYEACPKCKTGKLYRMAHSGVCLDCGYIEEDFRTRMNEKVREWIGQCDALVNARYMVFELARKDEDDIGVRYCPLCGKALFFNEDGTVTER